MEGGLAIRLAWEICYLSDFISLEAILIIKLCEERSYGRLKQ